jgi:phenylalanyl-tRNA synthetase beta chain
MTVSYQWLSEYLPVSIDPNELSKILTSVGLEVESMTRFESVRGSLEGLVVGEVLTCDPHPDASKLKLTSVDTGNGHPLQIVCGAPNVAVRQKVVVAPVGTTIYPVKGEPVTMKTAKIRGIESNGMIVAEDEIGIGSSHDGIIVLPPDLKPGTPASEYFKPYADWIYEIGLTPNRMDAMSHLGIAKDVCAYLNHHNNGSYSVKTPLLPADQIPTGSEGAFHIEIRNEEACGRYSGVYITGLRIGPSPKWLADKLVAIGQRPINNIVDITNYVLHETGRPLHAFDANKVTSRKIIVQTLPEGTVFTTLDEKERKLSADDLMICNGANEGMCIAGIFGGLESGVKDHTTEIFLESAWFNPIHVRKTSFRHGLRTEAATHFEKNVDISNTIPVLHRAASLMCELAGGKVEGEYLDVYPRQFVPKTVDLKYDFLRRLSGKTYAPQSVTRILKDLGFTVETESAEGISVRVPAAKPDIELPADLVEEIMRIDGLDNIEIPRSIMISPSTSKLTAQAAYKEKLSNYLTGVGFHEIFTNSITNAAYFGETQLHNAVRLLNNLSSEHNLMRPSMLETGLESVAYNINRKNENLKFFEFGKTYLKDGESKYAETEHLCFYITGKHNEKMWNSADAPTDLFFLKGLLKNIFLLTGTDDLEWGLSRREKLSNVISVSKNGNELAVFGTVANSELARFDIRQPVYFGDINWELLVKAGGKPIVVRELPRQMPVHRDLSMVVDRTLQYQLIEDAVRSIGLQKLTDVRLFDVFESEKIGGNRKSLAISFSFLDPDKTLNEKEIDGMMKKIMTVLETKVGAEIRK